LTALLLGYEDIAGAREFLMDALGFEERWVAHNDDGSISRSHLQLGDTLLMLDKPGAHGVKNPRRVGGVTHLILITVGDVDAHHDRAVAAGADILAAPAERPWGRDYELKDPEGYIFSFIS
jgi:MerR family transcriptional regulator, thiopeptide resistance regulator